MFEEAKKRLYQSGLWHKFFKSRTEEDYWIKVMERIIEWYHGRAEYLFPFPTAKIKVREFDEKTNALLTFIAAENAHGSYLSDLKLDADVFAGKRVGDIGSGPFPTLLVFNNCERYCIDHLFDVYRYIGYPLAHFEDRIHFITAKTEKIPLPDAFFDVLVSRNALDHVDNFEETCREVKRLLKPGGWVHLLVNYHQPTSSEPQVLEDERVLRGLGGLELRKVHEQKDAWGFTGGKSVLWTNLPPSLLRL